jgi:cutinase
MHNVVSKSLSAELKGKVAGVALFGDTRNQQDKGHIPNFPPEKSKVWCNASDGVCGGQLNVNAGHLSYSSTQIGAAATYLAGLAKTKG